jgi:hypothetical protein
MFEGFFIYSSFHFSYKALVPLNSGWCTAGGTLTAVSETLY